MTEPLPPFGDREQCAKCTCNEIDDSYRAARPQLYWGGSYARELIITDGGDHTGECLLRTCRDCGWA